jgi:hypothetical protein
MRFSVVVASTQILQICGAVVRFDAVDVVDITSSGVGAADESRRDQAVHQKAPVIPLGGAQPNPAVPGMIELRV